MYSGTMLRLTTEQRRLLAEKLLDLANLVATALVFGQFVGQQSVSLNVMTIGFTVWTVLAWIAHLLTGRRS